MKRTLKISEKHLGRTTKLLQKQWRYFEKHWGKSQKILLKYIQIILLDHSLPQKVKLTEGTPDLIWAPTCTIPGKTQLKTVDFLVSIKRSCSSSSDQHDESQLMIYVVLFYCIGCRHCIWRRKVRQVVRGPGAATISVTNHQPARDTSILLSSTLFLLVQSPQGFADAALVPL